MFRMNINMSSDAFKPDDNDLAYGSTVNFMYKGAFMQGKVIAKNGNNVAIQGMHGLVIVNKTDIISNKMY